MKAIAELCDNELIVRYQQGEEVCIEVLVRRHQDSLFRFLYSKLRDQEMAEDLFQETFTKAIFVLKSGKYRDEGKFINWIMRIGRNLVIDFHRANTKMPFQRATEDFDPLERVSSNNNNACEVLERKQTHHKLRLMVGQLPPDQQEIIKQRMYLDMSFKQIAKINDCSINTVLGRMRYALANLRKLMDKHSIVLRD